MSARTWVVRRLLGRLRIDDDTVRHLSTFQRLGEHFEIQAPGDRLPIGARTLFRALRSGAASQTGADWVWPYWLRRQIDPGSPAFVPRGQLPFLSNVTSRNWTMVGNRGSSRTAVVDPRGLVSPDHDRWSLDWWIGAEDRWHVPAEEANVRQSLLGDSPVVETRMRVPGGDVIHRAYAIQATAGDGGDELVVVEVENDTPVPVAVAFAVRPYDAEGLTVVERIGLHDEVVTVDGRVAVLLPKAPSAVAASTFHDGDSARQVFAGETQATFPKDLHDEAGLAQAAFVYPLPHRQTLRVVLPLAPTPARRVLGRVRSAGRATARFPQAVPSAEQVANGWKAHTDRGMRLVLPDDRLQSAVDANRRYLLLFHDGADITPGPRTYNRFWFRDAAYLLAALDRYGFHAEAREVLASFPDRQQSDGFFLSQRLEWDANGAALWALAHHWDLTRDRTLLDEVAPAVAGGVQWIERKRRDKRRDDPALRGLLPAGISAEHLGPHDYFYWDDFWALAGLRDGARLLRDAGEDEAADRAGASTPASSAPSLRCGPCSCSAPTTTPCRRRSTWCATASASTRRSSRASATRASAPTSPCRSPSPSCWPATAVPSTASTGSWAAPPPRGPGPRRSTPASPAGAWATATTAGPPPSCSASCARCWSTRPPTGWRSHRCCRPAGTARASRSTTHRPGSAPSPTPSAGTASARRSSGSSSRTTPTPPSSSRAPASTPPGAAPSSAARRCSLRRRTPRPRRSCRDRSRATASADPQRRPVDGRRSRRRRSWALRATTMVDTLMSTAPTAGGSVTPAQCRAPAASGIATTL